MEQLDPYVLIIGTSLILIISYLFNVLSKKTNIPSVLMLIILGILLQQLAALFNVDIGDGFFGTLQILGIVGLIMIVLEAALDLTLTRDKRTLILQSLGTALLCLLVCSILFAYVIQYFLNMEFLSALVYAIPLSIMSSAIIIPSVGALNDYKREFMVYEATFSDILGIMYFYFLVGNVESNDTEAILMDVSGNIVLTMLISVVVSYTLVFIFQKLETKVKLFLLIAVLLMLYAIGKLFHLSSLLIILVFGLVLNNHQLFFTGPLKKYVNQAALNSTLRNFRLITMESAFVLRTFFFVIFGITITLSSLLNLQVAIISLLLVAGTYLSRFIILRLIVGSDIYTQLFIAPRGLITILLFFAIPESLQVSSFDPGILLFTIIITNITMTLALVVGASEVKPYDDFIENYWQAIDREIDNIPASDKHQETGRKENSNGRSLPTATNRAVTAGTARKAGP